jgi:hypothetical protein
MQMQVTIHDAHIELVPIESQFLETAASIEFDTLGGLVERLRDQGCDEKDIEEVLSGLEGYGGAIVWVAEV